MFTGIVEETGSIRSLRLSGSSGGKSSNSDIPFRRRQTGEESFKSRISRGSLFRICQRCSPTFGRRVCTEWACKIYEDALGCEGGVKVSVG